MDIAKWLQNATTEGQSPQSRYLMTDRLDKHNEQRNAPRRCQRSPAGSILQPALLHYPSVPVRPVPGPETSIGLRGDTDLRVDAEAGTPVSDHKYGRKPRRKTKPDLYEPKTERVSRGERRKRHRSGSPYDAKRDGKEKRRKDKKIRRNPAEHFEAKNVRAERLTLKPRGRLGLFHKGVASNPVRSRGLPDLAFSEMRFLDHRYPSEEPSKPINARKRSHKKGQDPVSNEEFSTYFGSTNRPPLMPKNVNTLPSKRMVRPKSTRPPSSGLRRQSSVGESVQTIERPLTAERRSLGFDNRGLPQEPGSYLSWSESHRKLSHVAVQPHDRALKPLGNVVRPRIQDDNSTLDDSRRHEQEPPPSETTEYLRFALGHSASRHLRPRISEATQSARSLKESADIPGRFAVQGDADSPVGHGGLRGPYSHGKRLGDRPPTRRSQQYVLPAATPRPASLKYQQENPQLQVEAQRSPMQPPDHLRIPAQSTNDPSADTAMYASRENSNCALDAVPITKRLEGNHFTPQDQYVRKTNERCLGLRRPFGNFAGAQPTYMGQSLKLSKQTMEETAVNDEWDPVHCDESVDGIDYNLHFETAMPVVHKQGGCPHLLTNVALPSVSHPGAIDAEIADAEEHLFEGFWRPNVLY